MKKNKNNTISSISIAEYVSAFKNISNFILSVCFIIVAYFFEISRSKEVYSFLNPKIVICIIMLLLE